MGPPTSITFTGLGDPWTHFGVERPSSTDPWIYIHAMNARTYGAAVFFHFTSFMAGYRRSYSTRGARGNMRAAA